ncbi:hypothetical protein ABIA96_004121 [Bradyrhizobium sp. LB11.1]
MAVVRLSHRTCENGDSFGKFLAKHVPLMENIQQISCVTFARE